MHNIQGQECVDVHSNCFDRPLRLYCRLTFFSTQDKTNTISPVIPFPVNAILVGGGGGYYQESKKGASCVFKRVNEREKMELDS